MATLRRRAFRDLQGKAFEAVVYRHLSSQYDALDISGSLKAGGRWNPQGEYGVLYAGLNGETAKAELERLAERQGLTLEDLAPRHLVSIQVSLSKVLDLTNKRTLEQLGISERNLTGNDVSLCLEISRLARRAGFEAILAASATKKGTALVVFSDCLRPSSGLEALDRKKIL